MEFGRSVARLLAGATLALSCAGCGLIAEQALYQRLPDSCQDIYVDPGVRDSMQAVFGELWEQRTQGGDMVLPKDSPVSQMCPTWAVPGAYIEVTKRIPSYRHLIVDLYLSRDDRTLWQAPAGVGEARRYFQEEQQRSCATVDTPSEGPSAIGDQSMSCWADENNPERMVMFRVSNVRVSVTLLGSDSTPDGSGGANADDSSEQLRDELDQGAWCVAEALGHWLKADVRSAHTCSGADAV